LAITLALTGVFLLLGLVARRPFNPRLTGTFAGVALVLCGWQAVLYFRSARKQASLEWEFVPVASHYVQAFVQFCIYVYWGWYWRNVYAEAPLILSQILFLYVTDALLSWSRGQKWRAGFGPWPIILSTNLFMWFKDDWFIFQFLMVATGVLAKQFIRWTRNGKLTHIFNPSAFALTVFSLGLIFTGTTNHTWGEQIALTQGLPPHLYTEIFLCGLVVQYLFQVTLMTFSAAAMLGLLSVLYLRATGVYVFIDSNIPIAVFLGLHLLMTDPATTPRSSIGRILFGSLYGLSVFGSFILLRACGLPEFYDKLIVVPFLNLLTPLLDRLARLGVAGKFGRWETGVGSPRVNLGFMGGWIALFISMLVTGFVEAPHPGATIGFWKKAAEENRPHAAENLRQLLNAFTSENLDDPAMAVGAIGAASDAPASRNQNLGILCEQVGQIYAEGKVVPANPVKAAYYFDHGCAYGNKDACASVAAQFLLAKDGRFEVEGSRALMAIERDLDQTSVPNARDCFLLAYASELGHGLPPDKARARRFYQKAAELGDVTACRNLGRMQIAGEGGPADPISAAGWLQKAADSGDGPSCLLLARLYHQGEGVIADEARATALLQKACNLGVQPACELLKNAAR